MQTEIERIEALIASERVADAVALLSETRAPLGYQLIERAARDGHRLGRLAKVFYEARSFRMVALCFEQVSSFSQAGKMYLKANDALSAAEMFWRDGQELEAAQAYEQGGEYSKAASLYLRLDEVAKAGTAFEKAGDGFQAGRCLLQAGRADRAIPLLQSVLPESEHYLEATLLAAEGLHQAQLSALGVRRLELALEQREVDAQTAPLFRQLALIHRDLGDLTTARSVLERLAAWNMGFEDTTELLSRLTVGMDDTPPVEPLDDFMDARTRTGLERLKDHALLADCSLSELRRIYDHFERKLVEPGTPIISEGDAGRFLFILVRGRVSVRRAGEEIAQLTPGSWFGEMSLVDDQPASATVVALDTCGMLSISLDDFRHVLDADAELARKFYKQFSRELSQRLRRAQA